MNPDQVLLRECETGRPIPIRTSRLAEKLGAQIVSVDRSARSVSLGYRPDDFFAQAMNVLQGGAIATMLDFALAFAVLCELPDGYSTATTSLTVSFIKPVAPGPLLATGIVDHVGRSTAFARGILAKPDGSIVATASSPLHVLSPRTQG